jgi:hypothetical protein
MAAEIASSLIARTSFAGSTFLSFHRKIYAPGPRR